MKNFEFPASLFFEKIPKWRGWKDIFYFFFFTFYWFAVCTRQVRRK